MSEAIGSGAVGGKVSPDKRRSVRLSGPSSMRFRDTCRHLSTNPNLDERVGDNTLVERAPRG